MRASEGMYGCDEFMIWLYVLNDSGELFPLINIQ